MIKVIFFDIDSTLVSHTNCQVPPSAREAIKAARARGIRCVIATGRHLSELPGLPMDDMEFDGYITLNGQLCYDANKQLSFGNPITGAEKDALISVFKQQKIPLMLAEHDRMYANFINQRLITAQTSVNAQIPEAEEYTGAPIYQAVAFVTPEEMKALSSQFPNCRITWWTEMAVDVVPQNAGKVSGIRRYLEKEGIDISETMAFGDGENDIDMLRFVKLGVAMGNAAPHVQAAADYVTTHIDEDGIANAMKHFSII